MIKFVEKTHQYFVDGIEYPSVTTILKPYNKFDFVDKETLARAAKFGTAVHKATELYDKKTLDLKKLDPALLPYVEAWDLFLQDYRPTLLEIEHRISSVLGYAGTLDRYVKIRDYTAVIDIKSGTVVSKTAALQLAAYGQGLTEEGIAPVDRRYVVHLTPFNYRVIHYSIKTDFAVFKSALRLYNWAKANAA